MIGDEYGSLVAVATVSTVIIVFLSLLVKRYLSSTFYINYVFLVVIPAALFAYSSLLDRSIFQTLETLLQIVVGPTDSNTRLYVIAFWLTNVAVSILFCVYVTKIGGSTTVHRKFFHLTVSLIYISGIVYDPQFAWICAWLWLCIFVLFEVLRYFNVPPWGSLLNEHLLVFKDAQDSEFLLTPIYLLIGIFMPLFFPLTFNESDHISRPNLAQFAGVAAVGVGDSFAAIIGSKYGKNKWKNSSKSLEGTLAMFLAMLIFLFSTNHFLIPENQSSIFWIILAAGVVSISEAFINSVDNFVLPLIAYFIL